MEATLSALLTHHREAQEVQNASIEALVPKPKVFAQMVRRRSVG